jgi:O-antigen/teichoic acid export membrane protein
MSFLGRDSSDPARPAPRRAFFVRRGQEYNPLLRGAYSLAANSLLSAGLGVIFWIAAAQLYPSGSVGRDSALIAAMLQASTLAQLNMANALVRFMPVHAEPARLLTGAYIVSGVTAVAVGTGFILIAPRVIGELSFLDHEPLIAGSFVAAVVFWGVFALQDAALTAMRQAAWVPLKNGAFGLLRLGALGLLFAAQSSHGVFLAWFVSMCVVAVPINWLLFRRLLKQQPHGPQVSGRLPFGRGRLARFLAFDYLATVFMQTALAMLPLLVLAILGSRENAYFYIPFTIAIALDAAFFSISMSLVTEGALNPERLPALLHVLIRRGALLVVPLVGFIVIAAPLILLPFGEEYVRESAQLLRIFAVASLFRAAVALGAAVWRVTGHSGRIAVLDGCILLCLLLLAVPLAYTSGVVGVAVAWLVTSAVMAVAVLPVLIRSYRSGRHLVPTLQLTGRGRL